MLLAHVATPAQSARDLTAPLVVLRSWTFDPAMVAALLGTAALYLRAVGRLEGRGRAFPAYRVRCFLAGLLAIYLALQSPIDTYANLLLSVHMVQHLLLAMVAPPLLLLGTPITVALRASSSTARSRLLLPLLHSRVARALSHPIVGWSLFALVLWGSHFTFLYEAALRSDVVHSAEHMAYLSTALLFWWPVVGVDPSPARISHPARLLYLFLAMPQTTFLGLAIYGSDRVLYPHYLRVTPQLGASALADQHLAGALMWTTGMFLMVPALAFVLLDWMRRDARESARNDMRELRAAPPAPSGVGPAR
jgi:cytochrome c oxidase assembly factor CtaG